ncbi:ABC transporter substrate-binding protein [Jiella sonneratiae]|uniref:ABC transporter substrate-binding protein n=1 Tax=Jiella sonneratiae TaxID=2816856 RepID=A0ABS3J6V3_9HYPH|nr:ABC transporter substrate-binding protein [Jiella sonneratiae]MBO0904703.1 ABC transporter substrate-binding protein [Jiella sonneratiae]
MVRPAAGISRRGLLAGAAALAAVNAARSAAPPSVTDMLGRKVSLPERPGRIVLLEAGDILTMGAIHPSPASLVVGWAATDRIDSETLRRAYEERAGHSIALVGGQGPDTVSLEAVVALAPDLVVASAYANGGSDAFVERLEAAGIPVIFSDAADNRGGGGRRDDLAAVMRLWGAVLGRQREAESYLSFVDDHRAAVRRRLEGATAVKTYLEVQSTYDDCCWAAGRSIWGELLAEGGGRALDAVTAPWFQKISAEQLIVEDPDVYIACGGGFSPSLRPAIGPGISRGEGRAGLRRLVRRSALSSVEAVRDGRVHGIWTGLITVPPLHPLFVELVAKWTHPDACADLDPRRTLATMNERFFSVAISEPLWVSLEEDDG